MREITQKPDHGYDPVLIAAVLALTVIGFGVISSAVFGNAINQKTLAMANKVLLKQMYAFALGMAVFFVIISSRWEFFGGTKKRLSWTINIITISSGLAMLGLVFFGHMVGGSRRWYNLGIVSVQPGEFFKVIFMVYLAYALGKVQKHFTTSTIYILKPVVLLIFMSLVFLALPDKGSMLQLVVLATMVAIMAMMKKKHIFYTLVTLFLLGGIVIYKSHNMLARISSYLFPEQFVNGSAYQDIMASIMVKMGGLSGAGLGQGTLGGLHWLPEQSNDYIVAVIMEDLGLAGLLTVIALYIVILWRSIRLTTILKAPIHRYAAFGLGMLIISQAIINIGVAVSLFPTKGATLPFISYGGSSMVAFMIAIAGLEWLHRYAPRVEE